MPYRARSSSLVLSLSLALPVLLSSACGDKSDDPDPDPDPDPNPSFWLVGDQGNMFGVTLGGEASGYPLEHDEDLRAITCFGERTAWVIGSAGTVLRTRDAGQSWDAIELPDDLAGDLAGDLAVIDWSALAVGEATPEGAETLWLVGSGGAILRTRDGGQSWLSVPGADVEFSGVATKPDGDTAVGVATDGSIWQLSADGASPTLDGAAALRGIARSIHAPILVAVGDDGSMLRSDDDGGQWSAIELPTTRDLFAVRVAAHDDLSVAVGEAGVVVRVEDGVASFVELDDAELGLHGLHLRDDGRGQAVGGGGTLLVTEDAGLHWQTVSLPTTATLRGVDDFHGGGHL